MRNRIRVLLAGTGIAAIAAVSVPGTAQAHRVYQGDDYVDHSYDGYAFTVVDAEDDNHKVWAGYYTTGSYDYHVAPVFYPSDPKGVNWTSYSLISQLTNIRVVEDKPGSSHNYYSPWHGYPVAGT